MRDRVNKTAAASGRSAVDDVAPVLAVRRSLMVGRADDPAEREADRMADAALASLGTFEERPLSAVSRSSASGNDVLGGTQVQGDTQRQIDSARGGGRPLGAREASVFSGAYGVDLSSVRVHTDSRADGLSRSLQANAFTTGRDVFFRKGTYQPGSKSGDRLIGHELAHVATEGSVARRSLAPVRRALTPAEEEAARKEANIETGVNTAGAVGGVFDATSSSSEAIKEAAGGLVTLSDAGKVGLGSMAASGGLLAGGIQVADGAMGLKAGYDRRNMAGADHIDKELGTRTMTDKGKGLTEGLGTMSLGAMQAASTAGHTMGQAVPGLGVAIGGLTLAQGATRTVRHMLTLGEMGTLQRAGTLKTNRAKNAWLPVAQGQYRQKRNANIGKTIVGGLAVAAGAVALAGLMATPVGWGLAVAAVGAAAIYGGVKVYRMYKERKKKKAFDATAVATLRQAATTAKQSLADDQRDLAAKNAAIATESLRLPQLQADITALQTAHVGAQTANAAAQRAYDDLTAALAAETITKADIDAAVAKAQEAQTAALAYRHRFAAAIERRDLALAQAARDAQAAKVAALTTDKASADTSLAASQQGVTDAQRDLSTAQQTASDVADDLVNLGNDKTALEGAIPGKQTAADSTTAAYEAAPADELTVATEMAEALTPARRTAPVEDETSDAFSITGILKVTPEMIDNSSEANLVEILETKLSVAQAM